jgi:hypothetical protein
MYFGVSMIFVSQNYFIEVDDVGMSHQFDDVQFTVDAFAIGEIEDLCFLESLDCHMLAGWNMGRLADYAKCTTSNDLA